MSDHDEKGFSVGKADPDRPQSPDPGVAGGENDGAFPGGGGRSSTAVTTAAGGGEGIDAPGGGGSVVDVTPAGGSSTGTVVTSGGGSTGAVTLWGVSTGAIRLWSGSGGTVTLWGSGSTRFGDGSSSGAATLGGDVITGGTVVLDGGGGSATGISISSDGGVSAGGGSGGFLSRGGASNKAKTKRKPDPPAPNVTMACSECGREFWSPKALYGHMRCHPERQWRGIRPPTHFHHSDALTSEQGTPLLPPVPPPPPQGGRGRIQEAEREVASSLVLLAGGPSQSDSAQVPTGVSDSTTAPAAIPPQSPHMSFPPSGIGGTTPAAALPHIHPHANNPPSRAVDGVTPTAVPPPVHVNIPPSRIMDAMASSGAADALQSALSQFRVHAAPRFECSSCKKVFTSHQALGGHRASHKNVKGCFAMDKNEGEGSSSAVGSGGKNVEIPRDSVSEDLANVAGEYKCRVCSRTFSSGQALGGHLRGQCRERAPVPDAAASAPKEPDVPDLNLPPPPESGGSSSSDSSIDLNK